MASQQRREFVWQQEKYSLADKKELGELDKNVTPPFIPTTPLNPYSPNVTFSEVFRGHRNITLGEYRLIHFAVFSKPPAS